MPRSARTSSTEPLIRSARLRPEARGADWPWTIPALRSLEELPLNRHVTFLVGENGSGKSTLVEGIADGFLTLAVERFGPNGLYVLDGHFQLTRAFLDAPERVLRRLFDGP